jgi:hypothetical protein
LGKHAGVLTMFGFIIVFVIATYSISQLTLLVPRALQGAASGSDLLIGFGYVVVTVVSVLVLGRMIYSSERAAGRVKRRVRFFE